MIYTKLSQETAAAAVPPPAAAPAAPAPTGSSWWNSLPDLTPNGPWAQARKNDLSKLWNSLPDLSPEGPWAKARAAEIAATAAAAEAKTTEQNKRMADAILMYTLGGFGAGLSGTKLYNLISQVNKPKNKYTKFGPGAKTVDDDEKIAADAPAPAAAPAAASASPSIAQQLSDLVTAGTSRLNKLVPVFPETSDLDQNQQSFFIPAVLGSAAAGLYGGHTLMQSILDRKRKEDIQMTVEEAKKEYQRALTGKSAAALDEAFATYQTKTAASPLDAITAGWNYLTAPLTLIPGAKPVYTMAVGGTGLLSGKMMYDWTRERSKDKALERARKSRARIEDTSPIYVDPEQIVAIRDLADKQKQKAKRPEPQQDTYSNY